MPKYTLLCKQCGDTKDVVHSIKQELFFSCTACDIPMVKTIGNPNIHLKGDNWTGKLLKEKDLRTQKSQYLSKKQRLEHTPDKVLPNVDGQVVSSWSDAKKLAKSKGYNTASYDKFGK